MCRAVHQSRDQRRGFRRRTQRRRRAGL
jgi:hypothetical protein